MKQRTRLMHAGDELIGNSMNIDKKNEGDTNGEIPLHRVKPLDHFIEAQVQEGDTLQAIALRFYCSISELKRINHIHKDNEIFARRTIKVPVTPYSVLTELVPTPALQPVEATPTLNYTSAHSVQVLLQSPQTSPPKQSIEGTEDDCAIDCNTIVLNSTLAPSVVPYSDGDTLDNAFEDTQLLPDKEKVPVETIVVKELTSHGADFGLKWVHLMCCLLVLGVVIPLVYIYYYIRKS